MKRVNQGLSIVMVLLLCITGFKFGIIANAEEPDAEDANVTTTIGEGLPEEGLTDENLLDVAGVEDVVLTEIEEGTVEPAEEVGDEELGENPVEEDTSDIVENEPVEEDTSNTVENEPAEEDVSNTVGNELVEEKTQDLETEESIDITFKVVNGSWDDGTTADKIVTLTAEEGQAFKLSADQIPAVGSMPCDDSYKSGHWDKVPSLEEIEEATTYTYTYEAKKAAVVLKAPEARTIYVVSETP